MSGKVKSAHLALVNQGDPAPPMWFCRAGAGAID
jgi:hypothetical protein